MFISRTRKCRDFGKCKRELTPDHMTGETRKGELNFASDVEVTRQCGVALLKKERWEKHEQNRISGG